ESTLFIKKGKPQIIVSLFGLSTQTHVIILQQGGLKQLVRPAVVLRFQAARTFLIKFQEINFISIVGVARNIIPVKFFLIVVKLLTIHQGHASEICFTKS